MTFLSSGVASLQWVGTVAAARQSGLGRVVTVWATNAAFDMGADVGDAAGVTHGRAAHLKLGYETRYHYREYVCWTAPTSGAPPPPQPMARISSRTPQRSPLTPQRWAPAPRRREVGGVDEAMGRQRLVECRRGGGAVHDGIDECPVRFHVGPNGQPDLVVGER